LVPFLISLFLPDYLRNLKILSIPVSLSLFLYSLLFLKGLPLGKYYLKILKDKDALHILKFSTFSLSAVILNITFTNPFLYIIIFLISLIYIFK